MKETDLLSPMLHAIRMSIAGHVLHSHENKGSHKPQDHDPPYPDPYSALSHENSTLKSQHGHEDLLDKMKIISIYKVKPSLEKDDFPCVKASPGSLRASQMGLPLHK